MKQRLIIAISFIMIGISINILIESNTIIHKFIAILGLIMYYRGVFREYKNIKKQFRFLNFILNHVICVSFLIL